jgi:hypothetical protein
MDASVSEPAQTAPPAALENTEERRDAARMQERAADALKEAKEIYGDTRSLDESAKKEIEAQFAQASERMSEGSMHLQDGAYAQATAAFTEAMRISLKLTAVLDAQRKFRRDIITPLLNLDVRFDLSVDNSSGSDEDVDD